MKISVIMATYNGEKYIAEQLASILGQTRRVDEVIIRDDCSADRTAAIVEAFISENHLEGAWKFSVNRENLGYGTNFARGLFEASGDYICFCDQDDVWLPDRIFRMEKMMEEHPEVLLAGTEFEPFSCTDDAPEVSNAELASFRGDDSLEHLSFVAENVFIGCQGCTMIFRKTFLDRIRDWWYPGWAHDEYVWKLALCMDGLYFWHHVTLRRRLHSSNVTLHREHDIQKRLLYLEELKKSHEQTYRFGQRIGIDRKKLELMEKEIRAASMRMELIRNRRLWLGIPLLFYGKYYHRKRSMPVEMLMAIRNRKSV
uniref:glycosyltransferase n=1 Tax=Eubacterium cellulosolvens TaxID=29322 RepID=UPI000487A04B|nr:glycosyltransferase [[Eubacterium] cellulosolvens]